MKAAERLARFPEYVFSRLNRAIAEIEKKSGRKVKNFGIGSPDVPPSTVYLDKLNELILEPNAHLYPGYVGTKEFSSAVSTWYKSRFGVDVAEDEILPLLGAKDGVAHLPLALVDDGDEVLIPDPGYQGFAGPVLIAGGKPVPYDPSSIEDFERNITGKTSFAWVNFPSNPTGAVVTLEYLEKIVDIARKRGIVIVYDNAYSEITFDGYVAPSIFEVAGSKDVAVELCSFSKTFSFAGYRIGWIAGNKEVVNALQKVKSQVDSGLSLPLQKLGAFALMNQDKAWHEKMIASYKERRDVIAEKLRTLGLTFEIPKGGLYLWAKIPDSAKDSESYVMELLKEKNVLFAPGSAFGKNGERYVRVSICIDISDINEYLV